MFRLIQKESLPHVLVPVPSRLWLDQLIPSTFHLKLIESIVTCAGLSAGQPQSRPVRAPGGQCTVFAQDLPDACSRQAPDGDSPASQAGLGIV